jgi:hypothetical protein
MEESAMAEPEISIQFKLTAKGKDAFGSVRRTLWLIAALVILLVLIFFAPRMNGLIALMLHHLGGQ